MSDGWDHITYFLDLLMKLGINDSDNEEPRTFFWDTYCYRLEELRESGKM